MNKENDIVKARYVGMGKLLKTRRTPYTPLMRGYKTRETTKIYEVQGLKVTFHGTMQPEYISGYDGMSFVWFLLWALKIKGWIEEIVIYNVLTHKGRGIAVKLYSKKELSVWRRLKITEPWRLIKDHFRKLNISIRYDITPALRDSEIIVSRDFVVRPSEEDPNINVIFMENSEETEDE